MPIRLTCSGCGFYNRLMPKAERIYRNRDILDKTPLENPEQ
jgi:hypothetical protein